MSLPAHLTHNDGRAGWPNFPHRYLLYRAAIGRGRSKCRRVAFSVLPESFLPLRGRPCCIPGFGSNVAAMIFRRRFNSYLVHSFRFMRPPCYGMGSHPYLLSNFPFLNAVVTSRYPSSRFRVVLTIPKLLPPLLVDSASVGPGERRM